MAGDGDLLPPRYSGDRRIDADDWAQDFCAYIALLRIPPPDAALLLRTRLTGAARTWLESVLVDLPMEDLIERFWQRFGAGDTYIHTYRFIELWQPKAGLHNRTNIHTLHIKLSLIHI